MIYLLLLAAIAYLAYRQSKQAAVILELRRQLYAEIHRHQYPQNWK